MNNVIEDLYRTFSKYKISGSITGCHCQLCLNSDLENFYFNTPLNSLTHEDISPYIHSVDIIEESCNDFRYFLPRILHIILESKDHSGFFFDIIWGTLARPNYDSWDPQEKIMMERFFKHYYNTVKNDNSDRRNLWIVDDLKEAGFWKDSFATGNSDFESIQ